MADAASTLIDQSQRWVSKDVRLSAIRALAHHINDPRAVNALSGLSQRWVEEDVRIAAVKALGGPNNA